jgi:hypothetical protein
MFGAPRPGPVAHSGPNQSIFKEGKVMRKIVASAAIAASAASLTLLNPASAHAAGGVLTICSTGAHSDVVVNPATYAANTVGPSVLSIPRDACSSIQAGDGAGGPETVQVSLQGHGRLPAYGPGTADDRGNAGFGAQPFDHTEVRYSNQLPPGGMTWESDEPSVTVTLDQTGAVIVNFIYSNQMH